MLPKKPNIHFFKKKVFRLKLSGPLSGTKPLFKVFVLKVTLPPLPPRAGGRGADGSGDAHQRGCPRRGPGAYPSASTRPLPQAEAEAQRRAAELDAEAKRKAEEGARQAANAEARLAAADALRQQQEVPSVRVCVEH